MERIINKLLIALIALCSSSSVFAYDILDNGIYYNINNNDNLLSVTVTNSGTADGYIGNVIIPESIIYDGKIYKVTSIGNSAFSNCSNLSEIFIGNSVTEIGGWAFSGCVNLKSVKIPDSVTSIGSSAFIGCSSLTEIIIGKSVKSISSSAFCDCINLISVKLPDNIESISFGLFNRCSSLASITIPNSVKSIDDRAFEYCSNLTSVTIPDSVIKIGQSAFAFCYSLSEVSIGDSVTLIGNSAFDCCKSLSSITIPNSVTKIDGQAFWGCSGLVSVIIGNSVKSMEPHAFYGCNNISRIDCYAESVPKIYYNTFTCYTADLHVPKGTATLYKDADYWKLFGNIVEDIKLSGVTEIRADDSSDKELFTVYDLQARKMNITDRMQLKSLNKGIYIVNGKKLLVK